jgi:hypothetical protein
MNKNDRETGRASNFIAGTGVRVSSRRDDAIRRAWEHAMQFSSLCVNFGIRPELACRILGLEPEQIDSKEWSAAVAAYDQAKNVVRNELREDRDRGTCRNPLRG